MVLFSLATYFVFCSGWNRSIIVRLLKSLDRCLFSTVEMLCHLVCEDGTTLERMMLNRRLVDLMALSGTKRSTLMVLIVVWKTLSISVVIKIIPIIHTIGNGTFEFLSYEIVSLVFQRALKLNIPKSHTQTCIRWLQDFAISIMITVRFLL